MTKFIEFNIKGKAHLVNIDNIAQIKQLDQSTLEFTLLTKDENNDNICFKLHHPYGDIKFKIDELGRLAYPIPFNVS